MPYVFMQNNFAFSSYFCFTESFQNLRIAILLISNIYRPKQNGLFIIIRALFFSIANKLFEKKIVVW